MINKTKKNNRKLTKSDTIEAYKKMLLIRRFEEKAGNHMGWSNGFCHLYIGQGGCCCRPSNVYRDGDQVITTTEIMDIC